jgi:hypothetical protein
MTSLASARDSIDEGIETDLREGNYLMIFLRAAKETSSTEPELEK